MSSVWLLRCVGHSFTERLDQIQRRHVTVVETMAHGLMEMKEAAAARHVSLYDVESRIQYFLDRLYLMRISIRLLIHQHCEYHTVCQCCESLVLCTCFAALMLKFCSICIMLVQSLHSIAKNSCHSLHRHVVMPLPRAVGCIW